MTAASSDSRSPAGRASTGRVTGPPGQQPGGQSPVPADSRNPAGPLGARPEPSGQVPSSPARPGPRPVGCSSARVGQPPLMYQRCPRGVGRVGSVAISPSTTTRAEAIHSWALVSPRAPATRSSRLGVGASVSVCRLVHESEAIRGHRQRPPATRGPGPGRGATVTPAGDRAAAAQGRVRARHHAIRASWPTGRGPRGATVVAFSGLEEAAGVELADGLEWPSQAVWRCYTHPAGPPEVGPWPGPGGLARGTL